MQDIIKQWPILSLLPMCTTDAGLSIEELPDAAIDNVLYNQQGSVTIS